MSARVALAFFTRLPVGDSGPLTARRLSRAAAWAPAVGLLVGASVGGVRALADLALPTTVATILALLAAVAITGALHEDGLADIADALGAHVDRERRLEILRDPRVGAYGALALVFAVLLAVTLLAPLDGEDFLRAAIVGHVLGRWTILPLSLLPSARADGTGSGALLRASPAAIAAGSATALAVALIAGQPAAGAVALGVAAVVTAGAAALFARMLGGVTGDAFGAAIKAVELATYAALVAMWS